VAGQAAALAQLVERARATRQQLVHIGLMTGVPQDAVKGRVEYAVNRQREFDRAQIRAEVATGARDRVDQEITDLRGQSGQLLGAEAFDVLWAVDRRQQRHGVHSLPRLGFGPGVRESLAWPDVSHGTGTRHVRSTRSRVNSQPLL